MSIKLLREKVKKDLNDSKRRKVEKDLLREMKGQNKIN